MYATYKLVKMLVDCGIMTSVAFSMQTMLVVYSQYSLGCRLTAGQKALAEFSQAQTRGVSN